MGYKLSPFLWRKVRRGLSAGRVQSVAVRLIDDREKEIENFKPEEYWNVDATLGTGHKSFTARLASDSTGKKLLPKNEAEARAIEKGLEGAEYTVGELKKGKRAKQPTPAFITSTLQQEASRRLGFTATRTTVSYTHLDVYKRQLYALAISKRFAPKPVTYKGIYSLELGKLIEVK